MRRTVPVSISMSPALALRLRVLAARENKSRSQLVCELLEQALPSENRQGSHPTQEDHNVQP